MRIIKIIIGFLLPLMAAAYYVSRLGATAAEDVNAVLPTLAALILSPLWGGFAFGVHYPKAVAKKALLLGGFPGAAAGALLLFLIPVKKLILPALILTISYAAVCLLAACAGAVWSGVLRLRKLDKIKASIAEE